MSGGLQHNQSSVQHCKQILHQHHVASSVKPFSPVDQSEQSSLSHIVIKSTSVSPEKKPHGRTTHLKSTFSQAKYGTLNSEHRYNTFMSASQTAATML